MTKHTTSEDIPNPESFIIVRRAMNFERHYCSTEEYSNRLKKILKEKNMTIKVLASKISRTHSVISKIQTNKPKSVSIDILNDIANALNCSYLYLLGKSDSEIFYGSRDTRIYFNPEYNCDLINYVYSIFGDVFGLHMEIKKDGEPYCCNNLYEWNKVPFIAKDNGFIKIYNDRKALILTYMSVAEFLKKERISDDQIKDVAHDPVVSDLFEKHISDIRAKNNTDDSAKNKEIEIKKPDAKSYIIDCMDVEDFYDPKEPQLHIGTASKYDKEFNYTIDHLINYLEPKKEVKDIMVIQEYCMINHIGTFVNHSSSKEGLYRYKLEKIFTNTLHPQWHTLIDYLYGLKTISELNENKVIKLLQCMYDERNNESKLVYKIIKELVTEEKPKTKDDYEQILEIVCNWDKYKKSF